MRKLVYYVATTADGFIAKHDGSYDVFLQTGEHMVDMLAEFPETLPGLARKPLGITAPNQRFDTVLMGRATYDVGARDGVTNPYPHLKQYVFSRTIAQQPDPAVQLVAADPLGVVRELKQQAGLDVWLCGGGQLAAELAPEIDALILKVNPVVIGQGIPLFARPIGPLALQLVERRQYANGYVRVHYAVQR